ncbi:hypothetical protein B0A49_13378 [Cryomyces minteri]|uniref:Uncharacterized protein n=1 Tax=Cryomyces minteri TaxID=331657 RepID=A0A4U0VZR7_9PEZI|nr:hypothetical protein B0A49_13378 [Cryomyces minteri]
MDSAQGIASAAWTTMITPATGTFALEIQAMKYVVMILAAALVGTFMTVASPVAAAACTAALITPFGLISGLAELVRYLLYPARTPKEKDDEDNGRRARFVVGTALLGVPHFVKVVYLVISKVEEGEPASSIVTGRSDGAGRDSNKDMDMEASRRGASPLDKEFSTGASTLFRDKLAEHDEVILPLATSPGDDV